MQSHTEESQVGLPFGVVDKEYANIGYSLASSNGF